MADRILGHLQRSDHVRSPWPNRNFRVLGMVRIRRKQWKHRRRNHRNLWRLSGHDIRTKQRWTAQQPHSYANRHHKLDNWSQCNEPNRPCISDKSSEPRMYRTRVNCSANTSQRLRATTWRRHRSTAGCWTLCVQSIPRLPHQHPSKPDTIAVTPERTYGTLPLFFEHYYTASNPEKTQQPLSSPTFTG